MKKGILFALGMLMLPVLAGAQPRPTDRTTTAADVKNLPDRYEARYDGGLFGTSAKEKGTLGFDDANERVVFYRTGDTREMFSIPYNALVVIYPDSKESVPQKGKVISALPLPGAGLFGLMSKSTKYANLSFDDPEIEAKGTASFRFDNKEMLIAFITKLGNKAEMVQRGDAYYRRKTRPVF